MKAIPSMYTPFINIIYLSHSIQDTGRRGGTVFMKCTVCKYVCLFMYLIPLNLIPIETFNIWSTMEFY